MTEEKAKQLITSLFVVGLCFLLFMISIMIHQFIDIANSNKRVAELEREIATLQEQNSQTQNDIDIWLNQTTIEEKARELNWVYKTDK